MVTVVTGLGLAVFLAVIVDTQPLREFGLAAGHLPGRAGQASERVRHMESLGAEAGQKMLTEAEVIAAHRLPPGTIVKRWQRTGVPEHEIVAAAHEIGADIIVLGAAEDPAGPPPPERHAGPEPQRAGARPEPPRHEGPPRPEGPPKFPRRHLSPTVRFVVNHAPCNVLLLYAGELRRPDG